MWRILKGRIWGVNKEWHIPGPTCCFGGVEAMMNRAYWRGSGRLACAL